MGLRIAFSFIPVSSIVCKYRDITLTSYFPPIPHIPTIPFHTPSPVFSQSTATTAQWSPVTLSISSS